MTSNWSEASDICTSVGARLCTKDELVADCSAGGGCQFNSQMIWSSTDEDPEE